MNKIKNLTILFVLLSLSLQFAYGQGSRYSGTYTKSSPLKYSGKSNFTIEGVEITGNDQHCIILENCENVVIKNSKLMQTTSKRGVYLFKCKNITVTDCTLENLHSGLLAEHSQGIKFDRNDVLNIRGTSTGATNLGNMIQFTSVTGEGNSVSYNVCENLPNQSAPEDIINLYGSTGTSSSPLIVKGNWLRGGGPSASGGGIMLGDYGGAFQIAEDNIVVNPGNYGIAIAGGSNMTIRNNKVFATKASINRCALYATNFYESISGKSTNITVENNKVNYIDMYGKQYVIWTDPAKIATITGLQTNVYDATITASILPAKIYGRAADGTGENGGSDGGSDGGSNGGSTGTENQISVYLDSFNRICVNCKGDIFSSAKVTVTTSMGYFLATQPIVGYHTVVYNRFTPGKYNIKIENGTQVQNEQITIIKKKI